MLAETRSLSGIAGLGPSGVGAESSHCGKSSKHLQKFRVGTPNVKGLPGGRENLNFDLSKRPDTRVVIAIQFMAKA